MKTMKRTRNDPGSAETSTKTKDLDALRRTLRIFIVDFVVEILPDSIALGKIYCTYTFFFLHIIICKYIISLYSFKIKKKKKM